MSFLSIRQWGAASLSLLGAGCVFRIPDPPRCGDGEIHVPEACDDANEVGGDGCAADCSKFEACADNVVDEGEACDDGNNVDGDGCAADCLRLEGCGNGVVEAPEECDDLNDDGNDGCGPTCLIEPPEFTEIEVNDTQPEANGTFRGNITIHADITTGNGNDTDVFALELVATSDLQVLVQPINNPDCDRKVRLFLRDEGFSFIATDDDNSPAGDNCAFLDGAALEHLAPGLYFIEVEEQNVGGGALDDLAYDLVITFESFCGDGNLEASEVCDDDDADFGDGCRGDCRGLEVCGDALVDTITGEACDDGDTTGSDGCDGVCQVEDGFDCNGEPSLCTEICGDGLVVGVEECDDGNAINTDICTNACNNAVCGDSIVRSGVEQCDDGNASNTDACLNSCQNATCGDGFVRAGTEGCDDANASNTDACLNSCQVATCGDGFIRAGVENCDGANLGGATCASVNANTPNGTLLCSAACAFDTSQCTL